MARPAFRCTTPVDPTPTAMPATDLYADGVLTVNGAADFLAVERCEVYRLMRAGALPWVKLGRHRKIPRRALVAYLAGLAAGR